ncbi:sugar ABC transporter permease [Lachnospiraceae bacterium MD1]|uniref:Sugar ABC transporter permease n=1 Tax=Variimorphobacter saccharofermentans TaxID=2755051 RepID=A0A839K4I6_9FIRM|nr:sugar ABC transporter permease [Variimorphobacter saccharofermentans]MBB2183959.1 sugar ABC transporter permease [Variimorphobacter saccharofermentans]
MKKLYSNKLTILLFILPALVLFLGILIAPIFMSGYYSLFDWKGFGEKTFIGFENYTELFTSNSIGFVKALGNSLLLALFSVVIQLPIALGLALLLGKGRKGERGFLSIYFIPVLISTVVIGQLWLKIYNPSYGLLNSFLRAIGLDSWAKIWLGDVKTALVAAFIPTLWQYVGYHMLLMFAGIKSVPADYREAAAIDGAKEWQINRYIVIPYIKPILKISTIFAVTGSLKSFDLIYVLTNGGPLHATEVPSTLMISMLFLRNRYGMGSTIAFLLIILCFAFALIIGRIFKDKED